MSETYSIKHQKPYSFTNEKEQALLMRKEQSKFYI